MSEEIRVSVNRYGPGRNLVLRWTDPDTGERKARSAGTTDPKNAERQAGELEKELQAGRCQSPSRVTWADFRQRYEGEKLASLAEKTQESGRGAMNHLERVIGPKKLCLVSSGMMSRFQRGLREEGMRATTAASVARHLRAALWAVSVGLLPAVPDMHIPKRSKGKAMRGRPLRLEEFERLLLAAPKVRPHDTAVWEHYLTGLWLSGLRLEESLALSWDPDAPFAIDLSGRRPRFRIAADAQKSGKDQLLPMPPDFAEFILKTPEADRHGLVFKLLGLRTGQPITDKRVSRIVTRFGEKAGIVVDRGRKTVKEKILDAEGKDTGETRLVEKEVTKFASAHDLRRSFGSRWARKVMPAVLQRLMRHESIETTMKYYVDLDADELADELWAAHEAATSRPVGNIGGNTGPNRPQEAARGSIDQSTEPQGEYWLS